MQSSKAGTISVFKVYRSTFQAFKINPNLYLPFLIFAAIEAITLIILYFSVRMPLVYVFGPPIARFWGERFLHYPANFLLLPKLLSLARSVTIVAFGSLFTGVAVFIALNSYNNKRTNLKEAFKAGIKKYISLFLVVFIVSIILYYSLIFSTLILAKYCPHTWLGPILLTINFFLAVVIQAAFLYAIPMLIIENAKLFKSLVGSLTLFIKLFIPTIILVALPMIIYIPILVLTQNSPVLINKFFPEIIVFVLLLAIIVNTLIIDPLVTVSGTNLFLLSRMSEGTGQKSQE